jgi:N-acetyl-anhydromuramyl-L-alanine amidase AmpD
VGHSDVAPGRKLDPGEKFPWKRLAQVDASIWPKIAGVEVSAAPDIALVQRQLKAFGYGVEATGALDAQTRIVLEAFQRRFRPAPIDGEADVETRTLLRALVPSG